MFKDWERLRMCNLDACLLDSDTYPSVVNMDIVRGGQNTRTTTVWSLQQQKWFCHHWERQKIKVKVAAGSIPSGGSQEEPIRASPWLQMARGIPWLVAASHQPHLCLPTTFMRSLSVCVYYLPLHVCVLGNSQEQWTPTGSVPCWLASVPEHAEVPSCSSVYEKFLFLPI